ncbi:MAG: YkgJ family cysteine cluster protein [Bryobacteraceae bacterium]|nr:YkgJ family cysteine cluster protein [Bryobacteraceae bacterium]
MSHSLLVALQTEIASRCEVTLASHRDWPCRQGCDHCCRSLARPMELTLAEWQAIPASAVNHARITDPRVCPFLDTASGACSIYDRRPLACRAYGFYVEREKGLYCAMIRERVESGEMQDIVWGNGEALEQRSEPLGPRLTLAQFLELRVTLANAD